MLCKRQSAQLPSHETAYLAAAHADIHHLRFIKALDCKLLGMPQGILMQIMLLATALQLMIVHNVHMQKGVFEAPMQTVVLQ